MVLICIEPKDLLQIKLQAVETHHSGKRRIKEMKALSKVWLLRFFLLATKQFLINITRAMKTSSTATLKLMTRDIIPLVMYVSKHPIYW
jgi:hypothetical protein